MEFVFGKHAVLSVLSQKKRLPQTLYLADRSDLKKWRRLTPPGIKVVYETADKLSRLCNNSHHQGVVLAVSAYPYSSSGEILAKAGNFIAVFDQVVDPGNLGALIRSAGALGVEAIVLPRHGAAAVTPLAQKTAVGTAEYLRIARVSNLTVFIKQAQKQGFWAVAAVSRGGERLDSFKFPQKTLLVLGSEEKGLRPLVEKQCDFFVSLALSEPVESLNVSVAFALFAYQRYLRHG